MKILAIGAHFDDVELGCGGSLLKWRQAGHDLSVFVATDSGYRDERGKWVRSATAARREGRAALRKLGARLHEGGFATNRLALEEPLKRKLLAVLKAEQPDLVLTHWGQDVHLDHRILTLAVHNCSRHVPRVLEYRSNWYENGAPFRASYLVDVSAFLEEKIGLVRLHRSEFVRTEGKWEDFMRAQARLCGLRAGVAAAEGFEVIKWVE